MDVMLRSASALDWLLVLGNNISDQQLVRGTLNSGALNTSVTQSMSSERRRAHGCVGLHLIKLCSSAWRISDVFKLCCYFGRQNATDPIAFGELSGV